MNNEVYEMIKMVGTCMGYALSAIALITMFVKPLRTKFVNWIRRTGDVDSTQAELAEIKQMLQEHICQDKVKQDILDKLVNANKAALRNSILSLCDICLKRQSITSIEKLNLIDMYTEYHNLGGDSYCTDRYKLAKKLPEIN